MHVSPSLAGYIRDIAAATRVSNDVALGASPRAAIALLVAAQAAAALEGAAFATPDDVKDVAPLVLGHRIIVRPEAALDGVDVDTVIRRVLAAVPVPKDAAAPPPSAV